MFGKKKSDGKSEKKKDKKLFKKKKNLNPEEQNDTVSQQPAEGLPENPDENAEGSAPQEEVELTEEQKEKLEKLDTVKSKISKILKSSNIEIVDENVGDEYEEEQGGERDDKQKQQDYDSLKAEFGKGDKNKKKEITLTIDDFDYTYVGKYVDEYDLMHRKNIKRIKLPSKATKILKRVAIVAVALIVVIVGIVVAVKMMSTPSYYIEKVVLSQNDQTYFVNEDFDFTGLYLYVTESNGRHRRTSTVNLNGSNFKSGSEGVNYSVSRDGNGYVTSIKFLASGTVKLTFMYGNYVITEPLNINVITKEECGITVKYSSGIFNLKSGDKLSESNFFVLKDHSNYSSELLSLSRVRVELDGVQLAYDNESRSFTINKDVTADSVFTFTYGSYKVEVAASDVEDVLFNTKSSQRDVEPEQ